jgi:hypothetical protein
LPDWYVVVPDTGVPLTENVIVPEGGKPLLVACTRAVAPNPDPTYAVGTFGGFMFVPARVMLIAFVAVLGLKLLSPAYAACTEFVPPGN